MPRRLTAHERALWHRVTTTIRPLPGRARPAPPPEPPKPAAPIAATPAPAPTRPPPRTPPPPVATATLDGSWDRRLQRGSVAPDRVIDLHGHTLDAAHQRLTDTLAMAAATGDRILLVVTGKGRGDRPGRIRAELAHWLEQPALRGKVAALRSAHPRHGGSGAFYVILRR